MKHMSNVREQYGIAHSDNNTLPSLSDDDVIKMNDKTSNNMILNQNKFNCLLKVVPVKSAIR